VEWELDHHMMAFLFSISFSFLYVFIIVRSMYQKNVFPAEYFAIVSDKDYCSQKSIPKKPKNQSKISLQSTERINNNFRGHA